MTNEEKADELSQYYAEESDYKRTVGYDCAIAMAEWKEQQMIEKAVEWLELNIQGGVHPQSTISFIKQFKQAMKGE